MYVYVFMALVTTLVFYARSQDSIISVSVRKVNVVFSTVGFLRPEESRVVKHVKRPRSEEASRKPRALSRVATQAIGVLAQGFLPIELPEHPRANHGRSTKKFQEVQIFPTESFHHVFLLLSV